MSDIPILKLIIYNNSRSNDSLVAVQNKVKEYLLKENGFLPLFIDLDIEYAYNELKNDMK